VAILRRTLLVISGFAVLVTVAYWLTAVTSWQEQVQLRDGSVITIDRRIRHERTGHLGELGGWNVVEEVLTLRDPRTGEKLTWRGPYRVAMFLDRVDGSWWLVAFQSKCQRADRGKPIWQAVRLDESGWATITSGPLPSDKTPNLLLDATKHSVTRRLSEVSLQMKRELDSRSMVGPLLRSIDLHTSRRC
jgi:hypothetical protein